MGLLIANDAFKYPPSSEIKINETSRPVEIFDDETLNNARLEIALEMSSTGAEERQKSFDQAWDKIHIYPGLLPGLDIYFEDEAGKEMLSAQATKVGFSPSTFPINDTFLNHSPQTVTPRLHPARRANRPQSRKETSPPLRRLS